jgi:peptide/nickel transport system substrate-binding protein
MTGGTAETLNPALVAQYPDLLRQFQLYDLLFAVSDTVGVEPRLAVSADTNKDGTVWTLHLRDGVTWHNGTPFTAADVLYTFHNWSSSANFGNAAVAGVVDFPRVRKLNKLTVEIPLLIPVAAFPSLLTDYTQFVVQDGSTTASFKTHPIGTGPFMFQSFTPGQQSVFARNPNYWESGKPYVDRLIVDSSFTDESTRLNALLSGQTQVLSLMPAAEWKAQEAAGQVTVLASPAPQNYQICMRVDKAPFTDVRVRQAMKYIPDRQAIIEGAFSGLADVGNDLLGGTKRYAPEYYLSLPPHPHDPEQAKYLLKAAGQQNLTFTLPIAPAGPGYVEMGTLFSEQAKAAGVTVTLQNIPSSAFFQYPLYPNRTIQPSSTQVFASLADAYRHFFLTGASEAETHWGTPAHDKMINQAISATDPSTAAELWKNVQLQQYNQGGEVVIAEAYFTDAVAKNVRGIKAGPAYFLNNWRLLDGWLA